MESRRSLPILVGVLLGLSLGLAVLLALLLMRGNGTWAPRPAETEVAEIEQPETPSFAGDPVIEERESVIVRATRTVSPVVVSISTVHSPTSPTSPNELLDYLRHGPRRDVGLGSGVLVDHRGYVLTASHVVERSQELSITLSDGQTFEAEIVGTSPAHDLAVVRIRGEARGLPVAQLGDSDALQIGEWAIAIGSLFGYLVDGSGPSITVGVISAVHRDVVPSDGGRAYYDMIQTDAAIHPGNSGGPLVNGQGEVIGINTTTITNQAGISTGIGFSVPINRASWVLDEILRYGRVRPYSVGLRGLLLNDEVRKVLGLPSTVPAGWLVQAVTAESPAGLAGLVQGDVVTQVNGVPLLDQRSHNRSLAEARVGDTLRLRVWRDGSTLEFSVTLTERPDAR